MTPARLSIRRALARLLAVSVLVPAALIWAVGRWTASASVEHLWGQTAERLTALVEQETRIHLETGTTALSMNDAALADRWVEAGDRRALLGYLLAGLRANPHVTWYTFAGADGAYLSAYRDPGGTTRLTWREQEEEGTRYRDFVVEADGSWRALPEEVKDYDPRRRAWYREALASDDAVWSKPFLFTSGPPGFILSRRARGTDDREVGVWAIEYEMSYVSGVLARSSFGQHGRNYLLTRDGSVIGHPSAIGEDATREGWIVAERDGRREIANAATHPDLWLRLAWERLAAAMPDAPRRFELEVDDTTVLAVAAPFRGGHGMDWLVIVAIPEGDILATIHRNNLWAALAALAIALGFLAFGVTYAVRRLSHPLVRIAGDLREMARLETEGAPAIHDSVFQEVAQMVDARERMRGGLRSFQKYVPVDLVKQLLDRGEEARLGGAARDLTVLFTDVADFTRISEEIGEPRILVEALGDYLQVVGDVIAAEGGTVDKFIGDGVMAFWGAPVERPDHALRACEAAWAMEFRLDALRPAWRAAGRPTFETRYGINTGEVVVGNIGSADRMNYTVMGDVVNVASRLEGICKLYGVRIAIGPATQAAVAARFLTRPVDCVEAKGKRQAIVFHELLGPHGQVDEAVRHHARVHTEAFDRFLSRDFAGARAGFEEARRLAPHDLAASVLISRCDSCLANPPPPDWTAAARLDRK